MRINQDRMIAEFAALVSIDSPSFGERNMGDYLKQQLKALGLSVSEDDAGTRQNGNCGNLYACLDGNIDMEPLLFCAHMDTVEPSRGKQAIVGENGIITSNGTTVLGADDCAGIAAILEALRTIQERRLLHRPIEVLFTIAEELYCSGVEQFDFSQVKAKEAYVLDLPGMIGAAAYKAPTILSFTVTIAGKAAHAGFAPEEGIHAIGVAVNAIANLRMGRIDENTTVNIGVISGGKAPNIVPENCMVSGEIRSYSHAEALRQAEMVKEHFLNAAKATGATVDFQTRCGCEAYETALDHPVVKRFEWACRQQELPITLQPTFGGSDNGYFAKHGITGIVVATAMNQCHSCEEYTTVSELHRIAELTVSLMTSNE